MSGVMGRHMYKLGVHEVVCTSVLLTYMGCFASLFVYVLPCPPPLPPPPPSSVSCRVCVCVCLQPELSYIIMRVSCLTRTRTQIYGDLVCTQTHQRVYAC